MKKIIFILVLFCTTFGLKAQVQVSLNVDANPTPELAKWMDRDELAIITVTNTDPGMVGREYRIKTTVLLDGKKVVETNKTTSILTFEIGTETYLADEIVPYNSLVFSDESMKNKILRTGMLPAGVYSFCVSLIDLDGKTISVPGQICAPMTITDYQMPELLNPIADRMVSADFLPSTIFKWTPVSPQPPASMGVKYILVVSEVRPEQSPAQALLVNHPIIEDEIVAGTQFNWPLDMEAPDENTKYVWSVRPLSSDDQPFIETHDGFVTPQTFQVGKQEEKDIAEDDKKEEEDEKEEEVAVEVDMEVGESIYAGAHDNTGKGEFEIITTELNEQNNKYSGKGTVYIDWAKANFLVKFDSIGLDANRSLVSGKITVEVDNNAPSYPQDWAANVIATNPWVNNVVDNVVTWVNDGFDEKIIPYDGTVALANPVKMPTGVSFPNGNQLTITEMVFKHNKSEFNVIASHNTPPQFGTPIQNIGFLAKNILFHPNNIELPPQRLELVEDVAVGNPENNIAFALKAPSGNNTGCYIEWDENGFSEFGVEIEASFTRDWLLPVPNDDETSRATVRLAGTGSDWNDLLLIGNMPEATIVDSQDVSIQANSIVYDMSDVRNPNNISFPNNYEGETSDLFRGFYMKNFNLQLSETWTTNSGGQPQISIQNMIIDNMGVTLVAEATNIVSFPNGEITDLYASIDTLSIDIQSSSLREAALKGRIGLPISTADSIQNPLIYTASFNVPADPNGENLMQLVITPTGPIYTNLLRGDLELNQTSNITAKRYESGKKTFDIELNGELLWENRTLGNIPGIFFGLEFENFGMSYDSNRSSNKLQLDIGYWAFASPQKKIANFPITINEIEFDPLPLTGNDLLRGNLRIPVIFNLSKKIGGASVLTVEGKIEENPLESGDEKFLPKFVRAGVDSIAVYADMAAVKIDGYIRFREQDPVFGDGFIGQLNAHFKAGGIKVGALAEFGNTTHQNNDSRYRYWRVEADAQFPAPGITFLPGLAFRGFGGGAFNNMEATLTGVNDFSFTPQKSSLGFMARAVLATTPKEQTFNADVGLLGQFSQSGGLTLIGFTGDFYVGAGFDKRNNAKITGSVGVDYDFPQKHFNLSANVNVNADPITTPSPASLVLDIRGRENKWFFTFGEPSNLNTVNVFGLSLYEYLMFGNDITPPSGFTNRFSDAYENLFGYSPGGVGSGGVGSHTTTGKGFALGIGFEFEKTGDKQLTKFRRGRGKGRKKHTLHYTIDAGAELHLAFKEYANCQGINGWRASGGLGFYASAAASVRRYRRNGNVWWNRNVASLSAGGWIYGEFPKPTYAAGAIDGRVNILDLVRFDVHANFEYGSTCGSSVLVESAAVTQGDAAADQEQLLIKYVNPQQQYNFPTTTPIAVKYGLTPNEAFDVSEQQSDGTVKMRTFKMNVRTYLKSLNENTGSWHNEMVGSSENNLGEHLYTVAQLVTGELISSQQRAPGAFMQTNSNNNNNNLGSMQLAQSSAGMQFGSMGHQQFQNTGAMQMAGGAAMFTSYPPPSSGGAGETGGSSNSGDDYSDLPPEPEPVVNNLVENVSYKFIVTATLKEWNGSYWVNALKRDGSPVTQTVGKNFRTGSIQIVTSEQVSSNIPHQALQQEQ